MFAANFFKEDKLCDFLFVSLDVLTHLEWVYFLRNLLLDKQFLFLKSGLFQVEKGGKNEKSCFP